MSSNRLSTLFSGERDTDISMDFDECEMDAATIFFNSPGGSIEPESLTPEYQSHGEVNRVLSGDVEMELVESKSNDKDEKFRLYKRNGLRRSLSFETRKRMIENEILTSPNSFLPATKEVPRMITDKIEEELVGDNIKSAVERLQGSEELTADCARNYTLPTLVGKHKDLKAISPQTLSDLMEGVYGQQTAMILDCRYPYEYKGGHIKGALNAYTKDSIDTLLKRAEKDRPKMIVFHCEFSSQRAPTLLRHLRSQDRLINDHNYPSLYYPEIYILEGGYKAFFEFNKRLCQPQIYTTMLDKNHSTELRHFRVKSKSWTAGEKQREKKWNRPRTIRF